MSNYFPGKKKAKRSAIITPRTAQETQMTPKSRIHPAQQCAENNAAMV